jgi:uncharacterized protein (DUF488 family)
MPAPLLTIGHSSHPIYDFLDLLERHGVELVADVRSVPYSRFNPQFNQTALKLSLLRIGIHYEYFGQDLGGWPAGPPPSFQEGIDRLIGRVSQCCVAVLCAEEDPARCHRGLLIAPAIRRHGFPVSHIRGNGNLEEDGAQLELDL